MQGLVDFVLDSKPFHTKILSAGIHITFTDDLDVTMEEDFQLTVHQNFNLHTDHCIQPPVCCEIQGYETFVWEDERGYAFLKSYWFVSDPIGLDINPSTGQTNRNLEWFVGYNSSGIPVFYEFPECNIDEPTLNTADPTCEIGFEVYPNETNGYEYADPSCELYCTPQISCVMGLEESLLEANALEASETTCDEVCGYQPINTSDDFPAGPTPTEIWNNNYYGSCSSPVIPCEDVSHTTVSARIYETLTIIEDGVTVLLDV